MIIGDVESSQITGDLTMIQVNSKCPKCREGVMKRTGDVAPHPEAGPLAECGFEDDAIVEAKSTRSVA
jgi:hypothetical protein